MVPVAVAVRWVGGLEAMEIMCAEPVGVRCGRGEGGFGGGGGVDGDEGMVVVVVEVDMGVDEMVFWLLFSLPLYLPLSLVLVVPWEVVEEKVRQWK
jgi:hypothetical protein